MTNSQPTAPHDAFRADVIAVAGDWHGDTDWAVRILHVAADAGIQVVLHAGDFGIWPGVSGELFLRHIQRTCAERDLYLLVTPGNHEDFTQIDALPAVDRVPGFGAVQWITDRIALLPRAHRFALRSASGTTRTVVSLGGGPSLDFESRTEGVNFWAAEAITYGDVVRTSEGGHADIMVAHDAPGQPYQVPAVEWICTHNEMGWSDRALAYATEQRNLVTAAFEAVAPKVFFHGHYHATGKAQVKFDDTGASCEVICLPHQRQAGNLVALDLDTLEVSGLTNPPVF